MTLHSNGTTKHGCSYAIFDMVNQEGKLDGTGENGWSQLIFLWVTLLSWVSQPNRSMCENIGKYNPQRQESGFKCPRRLL